MFLLDPRHAENRIMSQESYLLHRFVTQYSLMKPSFRDENDLTSGPVTPDLYFFSYLPLGCLCSLCVVLSQTFLALFEYAALSEMIQLSCHYYLSTGIPLTARD